MATSPMDAAATIAIAVSDWLLLLCPLFVWYSEEGLGGTAARPGLSSLYQMLTAHPPTASVPITALLYNDPLLCGFNMPVNR